jgi:hypothetical protein
MEVTMKRCTTLTLMLMLMLTLTFAGQFAHAGDLKVKTTKKLQIKSNPSSKLQKSAGPLKGNLKLTPARRMRAKANRIHLTVKLAQLRNQFAQMDQMAQEYEMGVATMPEIQKQCADKSYSVQDQMDAGCNGNETLNQCMEKLVAHCMANFSTPGVAIGGWSGMNVGGTNVGSTEGVSVPSISVESFRKAAKQTAVQAKALSRKLNQYAGQAERNANAWK